VIFRNVLATIPDYMVFEKDDLIMIENLFNPTKESGKNTPNSIYFKPQFLVFSD